MPPSCDAVMPQMALFPDQTFLCSHCFNPFCPTPWSQFIFWSPSHPVDCLIDFTGCSLKSKFLKTEYQTWPCPAPFNQSSPDPKCHPQCVHSPWLSPSQSPSTLMHPPTGHSLYFHMLAMFPQTDWSSLRTSIVSYSSNITYCAIQT